MDEVFWRKSPALDKHGAGYVEMVTSGRKRVAMAENGKSSNLWGF
jgi:hypothetical protein